MQVFWNIKNTVLLCFKPYPSAVKILSILVLFGWVSSKHSCGIFCSSASVLQWEDINQIKNPTFHFFFHGIALSIKGDYVGLPAQFYQHLLKSLQYLFNLLLPVITCSKGEKCFLLADPKKLPGWQLYHSWPIYKISSFLQRAQILKVCLTRLSTTQPTLKLYAWGLT